ncbi:MAG: hypothetical protein ACP5P4_05280 [Steroidobacteraceae bacterium]
MKMRVVDTGEIVELEQSPEQGWSCQSECNWWLCSLPHGHNGQHVTYIAVGFPVAFWSDGDAKAKRVEAVRA